jgi:nucleotide-binding universal stress UspA family protein
MLVCSIGSKRRASTLRFATEVALALRADTTFLGVVSKKDVVEELARALEGAARILIDAGLPVQVRVEVGNAEKIVLAEMREQAYGLVVVGALGGKRSLQGFMNLVGMRIVRQAQSSVLVVKGDRPSLSSVLICVSGAEQGRGAVRLGALVACGAGAQVTLLHVVDPMPSMYVGLEQMEETLAELLQSDTELARELKRATQIVREQCSQPELKLRRGMAADEILLEAQEGQHDLIVLGSSLSASGLVRALMGDLTREVVAHAQRPVLVVAPPGQIDETSSS